MAKSEKRARKAEEEASTEPQSAGEPSVGDKKKKKESKKEGKEAGKKRDREEPPSQAEADGGNTEAAQEADRKQAKKQKKEKKAAASSEGEQQQSGQEPQNPNSLDAFDISPSIKDILRADGINELFAIQKLTLPPGLQGRGVVGRARTGQGKTLGFVLPIVERLLREQRATPGGATQKFGRHPSTICLAPTRELAKQVHEVFQKLSKAANLATLVVYGGAPYEPQESALRRGVDVVVGTPGRIKDLMARGALKLDAIRFRVLDEVDQMLAMGFIEDVETILKAEEGRQDVIQTFLFSATMPGWIKSICQRFLKPDHAYCDLVGDDKNAQAAATSVRHLMLPCHWQQRNALIKDVITSYGCGGRTIVFTDTKSDCGSLALYLQDSMGAQPIHGDLAQKMREQALQGFKSGQFPVLVATDVAARGLDISGVELVVMIDPPSDWESYIHRSGRTGRAGRLGTCVMCVTRKMEYMVPIIENKGKFKFERIGAPQPQDMARIAAERTAEQLRDIEPSVITYFKDAASNIISEYSSPEEALARALAKLTGYKAMRARSLLTAHDDCTTLLIKGPTKIEFAGAVWSWLRRTLHLEESICDQIKRMTLTADGLGAVFDAPSELVPKILAAAESSEAQHKGISVSTPSALPEIKQKPMDSPGGFGGSRGGYGASGSGGGFGGRGGSGGRGGYGGRGSSSSASSPAQGGGGRGDRGRGRGGRGRGRF